MAWKLAKDYNNPMWDQDHLKFLEDHGRQDHRAPQKRQGHQSHRRLRAIDTSGVKLKEVGKSN